MENPATDSDRVKAPVAGAGSTDFEGSPEHEVANQAGAEGLDRLAPTVSQKTSEEEVNQASAEGAAFRALRTKVECLVDFILGKKNLHTQLKNMARSTNRALTELIKLRQNPKPRKTVSSIKTGRVRHRPSSRKGKRYRRTVSVKERHHLKHRGRKRQKEAKEE